MLTKMSLSQSFLNFIQYMKRDNVTMHDAFMRNWLKSTLCDAALFITSCINDALTNEIRWLTLEERVALGLQI
jgi:hypothetical protein